MPFGELPQWLSEALPALELRVRVVDYWAEHNSQSEQLANYLQRLGFEVDLVVDAQQEPSACGFVAARVVNDLHAAGDDWWTCDPRRAVDHQWVRDGNRLLERTTSEEIDSGFMAGSEQVDTLVERFWQEDAAPSETRVDCSDWYPIPGAASLDSVLAGLAEDLHRAVTADDKVADQRTRFRIPNTALSTQAGLHWFTIAYAIRKPGASICDDSDQIGQDCPSLWEEMMMEEDEGPTAQELEMADEMWDNTWEDE